MRTILWLLCLVLVSAQPPSNSPFYSENAPRDQFSFRDGILEIGSGRGWLRTPRLYSDFRLSLEFRARDDRAAAHLVLRSLISEGRVLAPSFRIPVPQLLSAIPATALTGPKYALKLVREGRVQARAMDEWQRLEVEAVRRAVTLRLNDEFVGEYDIENLTGYLLITSDSGRIHLRNVTVTALEPSFNPPAGTFTLAQVTQAKGRQPKVRKEVKPFYTIETLHQRKVHGNVLLEAIVLPNGAVGDVRVTRSLDPDLDQSAIAALRQWLFSPAVVDDAPVPVLVEVELTFRIDSSR
jgi:TonB family protein